MVRSVSPTLLAISACVGGLAAMLACAVWSLIATVAGGQEATLPLDMALITGALQAVGFLLLRVLFARERRALVLTGLGGWTIFLLLSEVEPFGIGAEASLFWGLVGSALVFCCVALMIRATFQGLNIAAFRRIEIETIIIRLLRGFGIAFFTISAAFPFYVMVVTSLKKQSELLANPLDLAIDFSQGFVALFASYGQVLTEFHFGRYIGVSTLVSVLTVVITLALAIPGAYAVARLRFPGRVVLSRSILLIYMFPAIVLVIPLYTVFSQLGLRNSLFGLLIVYPATTLPVALYMLQGYFRGLPAELEEAGIIDGCSRWQVILKITLPLSLPALASVALYVFMIAWNEFLFAFMFLDDPSIFTLSRGVVSLNSSEVPRQFLMAGAVIVTVPIMAIFLWFERYLVTGLTAGAVKG